MRTDGYLVPAERSTVFTVRCQLVVAAGVDRPRRSQSGGVALGVIGGKRDHPRGHRRPLEENLAGGGIQFGRLRPGSAATDTDQSDEHSSKGDLQISDHYDSEGVD